MNTNKNLLGTLFLVLGTVACTLGAHAANSADRDYYVLVNTKGAKGEETEQKNLYTAYYCTKAQAGKFFGGADTYQAVTTFLTSNMANYKSGMSELATGGGVLLGTKSFDVEDAEYSFSTSVGSAPAAGDYLAIVAYDSAKTDAENIVRVFSSSPNEFGILFAPGETGGGVAGDWTTVNVPEPTSGMLLLLGIAGLALKRKRVVSC